MADDALMPPPNNAGKRYVGTIDVTPTWKAMLPVMIEALTNGTPTGKQLAREELARMADLADHYVAEHKT